MKLLNEEQHQFLMDNYIGLGNAELTSLINDKFGTNFKVSQIEHYKHNRHLNSGLTGRFEKGQKSWNKGKTWAEFMTPEGQINSRKTWYKKGNNPANMDKVGTEKWKSSHKNRNDEGFLYVKVQDKHGRFNWKAKHRLLWEEYYGKIPRGHKVIFLDGNRHNITINNLALVSNSQMLILNKRDLIFSDKDLTETGIIISQLIDKTNKVKKKNKGS